MKGKGLMALLVIGGIAALILIGVNPSPHLVGASEPMENVITARGVGSFDMRPDMGILRLGMETEGSSATEALRANNEAINQVIEALKNAGVKEADICTGGFSIWPVYPEDRFEPMPRGDANKPGISAFRVVNTLVVRTDDVDGVGRLIDVAAAAGANRVDGVSFERKDADSAKAEALKAAISNARKQADVMAAAVGVKIVGVVSVTEEGGSSGFRTEYAKAAMDTSIMPGDVTFTSNVSVVYRFAK